MAFSIGSQFLKSVLCLGGLEEVEELVRVL